MAEGKVLFKYERKRVKKDKKMLPLCRNYKPREGLGDCEMANSCKNATYSIKGQDWGICYGGTKSSEREDREKSLGKTAN